MGTRSTTVTAMVLGRDPLNFRAVPPTAAPRSCSLASVGSMAEDGIAIVGAHGGDNVRLARVAAARDREFFDPQADNGAGDLRGLRAADAGDVDAAAVPAPRQSLTSATATPAVWPPQEARDPSLTGLTVQPSAPLLQSRPFLKSRLRCHVRIQRRSSKLGPLTLATLCVSFEEASTCPSFRQNPIRRRIPRFQPSMPQGL